MRAAEAEGDLAVYAADVEARRKERLSKNEGATKKFMREFRDNPFGRVRSVCDQLLFQNDLQLLQDGCQETLQRAFPNSNLS